MTPIASQNNRSAFVLYVSGLALRTRVEIHLKGGQSLSGFIAENLTADTEETLTVAKDYLLDGSPNGLTLIRLSDVSALPLPRHS